MGIKIKRLQKMEDSKAGRLIRRLNLQMSRRRKKRRKMTKSSKIKKSTVMTVMCTNRQLTNLPA